MANFADGDQALTGEWNPSHGYATQYALEGLRALSLSNGGAVAAILAFCGGAKDDRINYDIIASALASFSAGLAAALLTCAFAYYAQAAATHSRDRLGTLLEWGSGLSAMSSIAAFVIGSVIAVGGFNVHAGKVKTGEASAHMSCDAAVAFIKAQADRGPDTSALNKTDGSTAVLVGGSRWIVLPRCNKP